MLCEEGSNKEIAKVLLQTGKLELENMKGVSDYMKNPDGSIVFNFYDTENNYVIKMDSLTVVNSIALQMGDNSSCNENPNERTPAFEPSDQINRDVDVKNGGYPDPTIATVSKTDRIEETDDSSKTDPDNNLSRAVNANTLFPPGIEDNKEEKDAWYSCLIPKWTKQFSGNFMPGP